MSPTACAYCPDSRSHLRKAVALLWLLGFGVLVGCSTPNPLSPSPSATELLQERFPNRARTRQHDDGQWLIDWLIQRWSLPANARAAQAVFQEQRAAGYSVEEALLVALPRAGLWTHAHYASWGEVVERLQHGCPVVAQIYLGEDRQRVRRFVVLTGVSTNEALVQGEGADGTRFSDDVELFQRRWQASRQWALIACPPERATWRMRSPERVSLIRFYDLNGARAKGDALAAEAMALDPRNPDLLVALALRHRASGNVGEAEALLRRAVALDGRHVRALNNLAYLLAEQGRFADEAEALARRAVLLEPVNPRALDTQGFVWMRQGRWADARVVLERAWERSRKLPLAARTEIGLRLAETQARMGDRHLARQVLDTLREENPGLLVPVALQQLVDEN